MLVLWTALALSGLLFSLVATHGYSLAESKNMRDRQGSRDAALFCRNMLLIQLAENALFAPAPSSPYATYKFGNGRFLACDMLTFESVDGPVGSSAGGIRRLATIEGSYFGHTTSTPWSTYVIETKIFTEDKAGAVPEVIYTKEIAETLR